jgi:hypothetical protein
VDGGDFGGDFGGGCGDQRDAGENAMGASGEQAEHSGGVGGAFGLAEDVVVESDGGVRAEHLRCGTLALRSHYPLCFPRFQNRDLGHP